MDVVKGKFVLVTAILLQVGCWCTHHDLDPRKHAGRSSFVKRPSQTSTGGELLRGQPKGWLQSLESTDEDIAEEGSHTRDRIHVGDLVSTKTCEEQELETPQETSGFHDRFKRHAIPLSKSSGWEHAEGQSSNPQIEGQDWKYDRDAAEDDIIEGELLDISCMNFHATHFDSEEDRNGIADLSALSGEPTQRQSVIESSKFHKQDAVLLCPQSSKVSSSKEMGRRGQNEQGYETYDNLLTGARPKETNFAEIVRNSWMYGRSKLRKRSLKIRPVGKRIEKDPMKTHLYRKPRKLWSKRRRYLPKTAVNYSDQKMHIKKAENPMASPALLALFPSLRSQ